MSLRILAVSDVRTQPLEDLAALIRQRQPDIVLYAGDDVARLGDIPDHSLVGIAAERLERWLSWAMRCQPASWNCSPGIQPRAVIEFGKPRLLGLNVEMDGGAGVTAQPRSPGNEQLFDVDNHSTENPRFVKTIGGESWVLWVYRRASQCPGLLEAIRTVPLGLAGVIGNDCHPCHRVVFEQGGFHDLHRAPLILDDVAFIGLEGALKADGIGIGYVLYTEEQAKEHLSHQLALVGDRNVILVSHAPPNGVLDLALRHGLQRIGFRAVFSLLEVQRVLGVVCGHVHRCGGKMMEVHGAPVVNVACHDGRGDPLVFAELSVSSGAMRVTEIGTLRPDKDRTTWVCGVGDKFCETLNKQGIATPAQLAATDSGTVGSTFGSRGHQFHRQAKAQVSGVPILVSGASPLPEKLIYLDTEYSGDRQDDPWLVALLLPGRDTVRQYIEIDPTAQDKLISWVERELDEYPGIKIAAWGGTDRIVMLRVCERLCPSGTVPAWLADRRYWFNVMSEIQKRVALPVSDHKLETVASWFGYSWSEPEYDGRLVGALYEQSRDGRGELPVEAIKRYNADDVKAMAMVVEGIRGLMGRETRAR